MDDYKDWAYREYPPDTAHPVLFQPYPHQKAAWRALDKTPFPRRGLIVLPTGAGKTKTVVYWLHKNVLSDPDPRPILWIAHRAELIQQAARTFAELRAVGKRSAPFRLRCISGIHGKSVTTLLKPVDVVLCTVQSLTSRRHKDIVGEYFRRYPRCVIVIDEAHHAAADSYQDILRQASKYKKIEIIGLTATPTRTVESEIPRLKKIFRHEILYQIDQLSLIDAKILSRPVCHTIKTDFNFDKHLTDAEKKFVSRFNDIPPSILMKIGKHTERNKLIVNHYIQQRLLYGKTIVFATGINHCYSLTETFAQKGITADYVASKRHDKTPNEAVIERFRRGELDVLVSVAMLTEGVDIPTIQTVFLARPTGSEILMRQMVGRGMRGPKAGGHGDVHIVSFADHWERFPDWLDPMAFMGDGVVSDEIKNRRQILNEYLELPWELISAVSELAPDIAPSRVCSSLPMGWYHLKHSDPELGHATAVLVYDNQKYAFDQFINDALEGRYVLTGKRGPVERYFSDIPDPRPSNQSLIYLARYIEKFGKFGKPRFISFEQKDKFSPEKLAARCVDLSAKALSKEAEAVYSTTLASEFYTTKESYMKAVLDAKGDIKSRKKKFVDDIVYQKPGGMHLPQPGKFSLEGLRNKVIQEMQLEKQAPIIRWSTRPMRAAWGLYRGKDSTVVINRVLNTTAIDESTLRFLIYHELLHHELGIEAGHNDEFRRREKEYVGYMDAEAELDTLLETYRIPDLENRKRRL